MISIALVDGRPVTPCHTGWLVDDTVTRAAQAGLTWTPEDVHQHILITMFDYPIPPEFQSRYDQMNADLKRVGDTVCHCGAPGERYAGKRYAVCPPCAYSVHETCYCSEGE
ncbi:hypothetical protein SEA_POUND_173 [Mycobacterium phage Pound]|nr:hypothetical protein SEA_POUND_173 [Mycobacterium phage Pound]